MNIVARYLLALVPLLSTMLCCPLSSPGGSAPPPPSVGSAPPNSAPGIPGFGAVGVPRAQFLASWTTLVGNGFCRDGMYFRECFTVTEAECIELTTRAAQNCINANMATIPDPIAPGQGETLGRTLGECAGTSYEQALAVQGKRKNDAICNDPSHWIP